MKQCLYVPSVLAAVSHRHSFISASMTNNQAAAFVMYWVWAVVAVNAAVFLVCVYPLANTTELGQMLSCAGYFRDGGVQAIG